MQATDEIVRGKVASLTFPAFVEDVIQVKTWAAASGADTQFAITWGPGGALTGYEAAPVWKWTVRISLTTPPGSEDPAERALTLRQFYRLKYAVQAVLDTPPGPGRSLTPTVPISADFVASAAGDDTDDLLCPICLDDPGEIVLPCTHSYCGGCLWRWAERDRHCPLCQQPFEPAALENWTLTEKPSGADLAAHVTQLVDPRSHTPP